MFHIAFIRLQLSVVAVANEKAMLHMQGLLHKET